MAGCIELLLKALERQRYTGGYEKWLGLVRRGHRLHQARSCALAVYSGAGRLPVCFTPGSPCLLSYCPTYCALLLCRCRASSSYRRWCSTYRAPTRQACSRRRHGSRQAAGGKPPHSVLSVCCWRSPSWPHAHFHSPPVPLRWLVLQDLWSERALELRRNKSQRQRQKEQEQQREAAKERAEAQLLQRSPLAGKAAALATSGLRATALGAGGGAGRCCRSSGACACCSACSVAAAAGCISSRRTHAALLL